MENLLVKENLYEGRRDRNQVRTSTKLSYRIIYEFYKIFLKLVKKYKNVLTCTIILLFSKPQFVAHFLENVSYLFFGSNTPGPSPKYATGHVLYFRDPC